MIGGNRLKLEQHEEHGAKKTIFVGRGYLFLYHIILKSNLSLGHHYSRLDTLFSIFFPASHYVLSNLVSSLPSPFLMIVVSVISTLPLPHTPNFVHEHRPIS